MRGRGSHLATSLECWLLLQPTTQPVAVMMERERRPAMSTSQAQSGIDTPYWEYLTACTA